MVRARGNGGTAGKLGSAGALPAGAKVDEVGACPASTREALDGAHGGTNAGRACWVGAGTLCGGTVQGTFARLMGNCEACAFYQTVRKDEGATFVCASVLRARLARPK